MASSSDRGARRGRRTRRRRNNYSNIKLWRIIDRLIAHLEAVRRRDERRQAREQEKAHARELIAREQAEAGGTRKRPRKKGNARRDPPSPAGKKEKHETPS